MDFLPAGEAFISHRWVGQDLKTACYINSRNALVLWESERNSDFVIAFLKRKKEVDQVNDSSLDQWIKAFATDKREASMRFWYEIHKGITESLTGQMDDKLK